MGKNIVKPNFESINYSLRAAKNVERKMLCEAFGRLSMIDDVKNYRYVGFGSAYFTDFSLVHRTLGLNMLTSIEKEDKEEYKSRIEFNKPYSCIDLEFGDSDTILPRLEWKNWGKTLVWLDYTSKLTASILGDINTVVANVKNGSIFLISINISPDEVPKGTRPEEAKILKLTELEKRIEKGNIPTRAYELNLNLANNKSVIQEIIDEHINKAISIRKAEDELLYKQLFNFYYKDGAPMLTVGGIFYKEEQAAKIEEMFKNLVYIRGGNDCFDIIVPNLTYKEVHALDKLLPINSTVDIKNVVPLSQEDIDNYKNIYRYFPNFSEVSL